MQEKQQSKWPHMGQTELQGSQPSIHTAPIAHYAIVGNRKKIQIVFIHFTLILFLKIDGSLE